MTRYVTEDDLVAAVPHLTRSRLRAFLDAEIVLPVLSDRGPVFRAADLARLHLACDLAEDFDLHDDALCLVLSLVDRLHGARAELRAVLSALDAEPEPVRQRIAEAAIVVRLKR